MFNKYEIDDLVANCLNRLEIKSFTKESDFQEALTDALRASSDSALWKWTREEQYKTSGLPNEIEMYFDISGVYKNTCKVLIELKYVPNPPEDFYAFSYDLLKDSIKIELAMSQSADTVPVGTNCPVVYGLSIGLTDCPNFWEDATKGKNSWSRNSLSLLRNSGAKFERVETVGRTPEKLNNTIYQKGNKRCHLSFGLNWSINWGRQFDSWRYVTITPSKLHSLDIAYKHDMTDPSWIPFLTKEARDGWIARRDEITRKKK